MKWLIVSEDYDLYWTDDDAVAKNAARTEMVWNTEDKQYYSCNRIDEFEVLLGEEMKEYTDDEDNDD